MPHHHRRPTRLALALVATLGLAACAGDDDAPSAASTSDAATATTSTRTDTADTDTADTGDGDDTTTDTSADSDDTVSAATSAATDPPATPTTDTSDASDTSDAGSAATVVVESLDDIPQACQDLLGDFLRLVEPTVSDVDWSNPTVGEFQRVSEELADEFENLDGAEQAEGCDAFDFGDGDASLAAVVELAEREAPGTVEWLEFIGSLGDAPATSAELPTDCDAAIAYIDALVADGSSLADVPFSEVDDIAQVLNTISTDCDPETAAEFLERQEISDFLG